MFDLANSPLTIIRINYLILIILKKNSLQQSVQTMIRIKKRL